MVAVNLKFYRATKSKMVFTFIDAGDCSTDKLKIEHRVKLGRKYFLLRPWEVDARLEISTALRIFRNPYPCSN